MKRLTLLAAACCLFAATAHAQIGMDFFQRSAIAKYFNPVVGKGAEYQNTSAKDSATEKNRVTTLGIVGKDTFEGKDAFWMEVLSSDREGKTFAGKMLVTRADFGFHRMIVQMPGQPAMEMPFNPVKASQEKMEENFKDWHSVGSEPVTVPAGTFVCEHLHNDTKNSDIWVTDKVTPFGLVKQVDANGTMILVKLVPDFQERITGPVQSFDPQAMRQLMMNKSQKPNQ